MKGLEKEVELFVYRIDSQPSPFELAKDSKRKTML